MIFNGEEKDYIKIVSGRNRPFWSERTRQFDRFNRLVQTLKNPRIITVPIIIYNDGFTDLQRKKEDIGTWLVHDDLKRLEFKDEPERYYLAVTNGLLEHTEHQYLSNGIIEFICDPYKYGEQVTTLLTTIGDPNSTIVTLFSAQGTGQEYNTTPVSAQPIFDVEFGSSTSFYEIKHIETMRTIKVIYDFQVGDKLRIDSTRRRIFINGSVEMTKLTMSSAWFDLQSGDNHFEVTPTAETDTTIRYTPRYL